MLSAREQRARARQLAQAHRQARAAPRARINGPITLGFVEDLLKRLTRTTDDQGRPVNTESTLKKKMSTVRTLIRKYLQREGRPANELNTTDLRDVLKPPIPALVTWIEQVWPKQNTRTTNIGYLVSVIRALHWENLRWTDEDYVTFYDTMNRHAAERNGDRLENAAPEPLRENPNIRWEQFIEEELRLRQEANGSLEHVSLALRVLLGPRRDHDYEYLKFVKRAPIRDAENDRFNYIILADDKVSLQFRNFKTVRSFGVQTFDLVSDSPYADVAPHLAVLATALRENYEGNPRTYLFEGSGRRRGSLIRSQCPKILHDIVVHVTGVSFGIQVLRRLYTNYAWANWGNSSRSIKHSSDIMAHSISTSHEYRFNQQDEEQQEEPGSPMRAEAGPGPPVTPPTLPRRQEAAGSSRTHRLEDAVREVIEVLKAALE